VQQFFEDPDIMESVIATITTRETVPGSFQVAVLNAMGPYKYIPLVVAEQFADLFGIYLFWFRRLTNLRSLMVTYEEETVEGVPIRTRKVMGLF
jgi:hypothetical protein